MRILICGDRSFAARGLRELLLQQNHEVSCFNRGPRAAAQGRFSGPVDQLHLNPHLARPFDVVINYILLKDESIERNIAYIDSLLQFCSQNAVSRLIHISSISSYPSSLPVITEDAALETDPARKGPYGANKVATELHLLAHRPDSLTLTFLRPGFILGPGLLSPIVGTAARLPWNQLLVIGNAKSRIPLISRELVNQSIIKALARQPDSSTEVLLLVDPDSPTRKEFLEACCTRLGCGTRVSHYPNWVWLCLAVGGECVARLIGQKKLQPYLKLTSRLPAQNFDSSSTQHRLGMDFRFDWRSALVQSLDEQQWNYQFPYTPFQLSQTTARTITFLGFGRIVKQRHLPALKRLSFNGSIHAYDIRPSAGEGGIAVQSIDGAQIARSDLFIVASPGPAHTSALQLLTSADGPVLVEKPLCYSPVELERWRHFALTRASPVLVCHNYRFKPNVGRMLLHMRRCNPGKLNHVSVHFRSPPVGNDSAAWLRDERKARTLLMDYSLHFLDLACMFAETPWQVKHIRHELDSQGHTSLIEGHLLGNYGVSFLLRQGFGPRRARLLFDFQNYSLSLGFFPDTFAAYMANDNPWLYWQEARSSRDASLRKIFDKLSGRDSDPSHALAIATALTARKSDPPSIAVERLAPFYTMLFEVGSAVYGCS